MHKWTLVKEIEVRSKASDTANNLTDISQWCSKNRWHGDELTVVVRMSRPSVKWYYVRWRLDWSIEDWRHKVRVTTQLIWVNMTDMSQSRREVKWHDQRLIVVVTLSRPSVYENKICLFWVEYSCCVSVHSSSLWYILYVLLRASDIWIRRSCEIFCERSFMSIGPAADPAAVRSARDLFC